MGLIYSKGGIVMELPYFQLLVSIHEQLFGLEDSDRVRCDRYFSEELNRLIKELVTLEYSSLENLLECLLQTVAIIILYQPFYGGNHRTALVFMYLFLDFKGYSLPVEECWNRYLVMESIFPFITSFDEKISSSYVLKYLGLVKKKDS